MEVKIKVDQDSKEKLIPFIFTDETLDNNNYVELFVGDSEYLIAREDLYFTSKLFWDLKHYRDNYMRYPEVRHKRKALIVDIDGTLSFMVNRTPYQYHKAINDGAFANIVEIVKRYEEDHAIIILTGRDEECKSVTEEWLAKYNIVYEQLLMRPHKDNRKDAIVKEEIYNDIIKDNYLVSFVLEDRNQVVEMWRRIGLTCLQVADGDF